jgi:hypothetical protein
MKLIMQPPRLTATLVIAKTGGDVEKIKTENIIASAYG